MQLRHKKILLGVCGSIAAYKIAHLVRLLVKLEAEVKVVMTSSASAFITPLTLSTLSKNPVDTAFVKNEQGEWTNHVTLGLWADHIIIAPATANTIAKLANGHCDNLLCAVVLSARCAVSIAPAMDLDMLVHPTTKNNLLKLQSYGYQLIDAEFGALASGLVGSGRMAEPEHIVSYLEDFYSSSISFTGKKILITAGPTQEAMDPVRFISNHSTGKMGYALAVAAANAGAEVTIISGPVDISVQHPNINMIKVQTAKQMYEAAIEIFTNIDIAILSAAVADYTPKEVATEKIKKNYSEMFITLQKTIDIAYELGKLKKDHQFLVGFALETNNEIENAQAKLKKKNCDLIVLNSMQDSGAGFGADTNKITILHANGEILPFELKNKKQVAKDILEQIHFRFENKN